MPSITERYFQAYRQPLTSVTLFKYPVRILMASDDDCTEMVGNLRKAWNNWTWWSRILGREGDNPRLPGIFSKAVVQAVILFGLDTWIIIPSTGQALGGVGGVARYITWRQPLWLMDGSFYYPPLLVGNTGGGVGGCGCVCREEAEYGCAVHCNAANSVPL